jgi:hypothetical protein
VFRVMLSGSGLRTFGMTAAPIPHSPGDEILSAGRTGRQERRAMPMAGPSSARGPWVSWKTVPRPESWLESDSSPRETPGRQRLAGVRPQLTAGIRAGSYAFKCSNGQIFASIQRFGGWKASSKQLLDIGCLRMEIRLRLAKGA